MNLYEYNLFASNFYFCFYLLIDYVGESNSIYNSRMIFILFGNDAKSLSSRDVDGESTTEYC